MCFRRPLAPLFGKTWKIWESAGINEINRNFMKFSMIPLFWVKYLKFLNFWCLGRLPAAPPGNHCNYCRFQWIPGGILRPKRKKVVLFGVFSEFSHPFMKNMKIMEILGNNWKNHYSAIWVKLYPPKPLKKHYHSKVLRRGGRKGAPFTKSGEKWGNHGFFMKITKKHPPGHQKSPFWWKVASCRGPSPKPL